MGRADAYHIYRIHNRSNGALGMPAKRGGMGLAGKGGAELSRVWEMPAAWRSGTRKYQRLVQ